MEFNYGPIRIGKWLKEEDAELSVLGATWMVGAVVVHENGERTNSKIPVRELVVERAMVKDTMHGNVNKEREPREMKLTIANQEVATKLALANQEVPTKLALANQEVANKLALANQEVANKQALADLKVANKLALANQEVANKLVANQEGTNLVLEDDVAVLIRIV
jgi:hypothetical protein